MIPARNAIDGRAQDFAVNDDLPVPLPASISHSALGHCTLLQVCDVFSLSVAPRNGSSRVLPPPPVASNPPHRVRHAHHPRKSSRGLWCVGAGT
jgi:hypothetical protein